MFETLTEKLNGIFGRLTGKGRLTEKDVDEALRQIRLALLEADVNFRVARELVNRVQERAVGSDVMEALSPGPAGGENRPRGAHLGPQRGRPQAGARKPAAHCPYAGGSTGCG